MKYFFLLYPVLPMGSEYSSLALSDLPPEEFQKFLQEDYTVIRTGGWQQTGWKIQTEPHACPSMLDQEMAHISVYPPDAYGDRNTRFYMSRAACISCEHGHPEELAFPSTIPGGLQMCEHACGWRLCHPQRRTFWPTRLKEDEKAAWWEWVDAQVEYLVAKAKIQSEVTVRVNASYQKAEQNLADALAKVLR